MRRREFIMLLGGAAMAGPVAGFLTGGSQRRAEVLAEPSVETKMTRRRKKWVCPAAEHRKCAD